jgi:hypothetical protein
MNLYIYSQIERLRVSDYAILSIFLIFIEKMD